MPDPIACPVCGAASREWIVHRGYPLADCGQCGHRFCVLAASEQHATRCYGDDYFTAGGAGYTDYLGEADILTDHGRQYGQILRRHGSGNRVLDVGCAAGFLLKGMGDSGWTGVGIDPNAGMVAYGRRQLGLDLRQGTLETFRASEVFDAVSMIQVVAHFFSVRVALAAAARMVRPGGLWLVETWNRDSLPARILGRHWHEYSPPTVLHWFTPATFARLGREFGMEVVDTGRPRKRIAGDHAKALMRHAFHLHRSRWLTRTVELVPDSARIPYPSYDLFWMVLRRAT